jgi:hypothetical protein
MMWRMEQPLTRHFEMLNPLLLNNPANPFGPIASRNKAFPTARFFSLALSLVDKEYLENVSGKHGVSCNAHEAASLLSLDLKARREKGRFVFDYVRVAKELLEQSFGRMITGQDVRGHRFHIRKAPAMSLRCRLYQRKALNERSNSEIGRAVVRPVKNSNIFHRKRSADSAIAIAGIKSVSSTVNGVISW